MTTFVGFIERAETITIGSYSSAKAINGVMHDIARIMKKVDPTQLDIYLTHGKKEAEELLQCTPKMSEGGFFVEVEEVGCASSFYEDTDEMEYKEGYIIISVQE
jgi:hypothetical protein